MVRHGETAANVAGLILGRADPPLTERGRLQAQALARALPGVDRVIASPLRRACETAEAWGRPVETDERWIELDYGRLDGAVAASVGEDVWSPWRADPSFVPAGGESLADLGTRVRAACDDLAAEAAEWDVVVVTHVSPIKAAVAWALHVGDEVAWRMFVDDASICRIAFGPGGPVLAGFNQRPA